MSTAQYQVRVLERDGATLELEIVGATAETPEPPDSRDVDLFVRLLCDLEAVDANPRAREPARPALPKRVRDDGGDLFDDAWLFAHASGYLSSVDELERRGRRAVFRLVLSDEALGRHLDKGDSWGSTVYASGLWVPKPQPFVPTADEGPVHSAGCACGFFDDGSVFVSVSAAEVLLWDPTTRQAPQSLALASGTVATTVDLGRNLAFSASGDVDFAAGVVRSTLSARDLASRQELWSAADFPTGVSRLALTRGGEVLLVLEQDRVSAFDAASGNRLDWSIPLREGQLVGLVGSPRANTAALVERGKVTLFEVGAGPIAGLEVPGRAAALAHAVGVPLVAVILEAGRAEIWDDHFSERTASIDHFLQPTGAPDDVLLGHYSRCGEFLVVAGGQSMEIIRASGEPHLRIAHPGIAALAPARDGEILTSDYAGRLRVVNLERGEVVLGAPLSSPARSPSSPRAATVEATKFKPRARTDTRGKRATS